MSDLHRVTYQSRLLYMFGVVALGGCVIASALLVAIPGVPWGNKIGSSVAALLSACMPYVLAIRPRLVIDDKQVSVVQPLSSVVFPFDDLSSASPGRFLVLHTRSGGSVRVWAVSNTNVAQVLGLPGVTGRAADEINRRVARRRE